MAKSIRTVLLPLLVISYVCGLRTIEFPAGYLRPWFGLLYCTVIWAAYYFFLFTTVTHHFPLTNIEYVFCIYLKMFTALCTVFLGLYHDKKFRDCMRKIAIVDDTLEKLGTTTDYEKLCTRSACVILGWFVVAFLLNYIESLWWLDLNDLGTAIYIPVMLNYCSHITFMDDLAFASIVEYIGLKFDQVHEHLRELATGDQFMNNECEVKLAWENSIPRDPHQRKFPNAPSSEYMTWITMHLHLDLYKISCEVNSVFGAQLTLKMACYFAFIAELIHEIFDILFIQCTVVDKRKICIIVATFWLVFYFFRLLLINYVCERVSAKANVTGDFINRVSYSTCNVEIRENILQFVLQITRAPIKFYGLGLFQFGFKFLHKYFESILTFLIILIQTNKPIC